MGWNSEAEKIALTKIREKSLKRPLGGKCSCCPGCCFARGWIIFGYIYGGIFLIAGIVMLIVSGLEFKKAEDSSKFNPTNCTTLSSNTTGSLICNTCSHKKHGGNINDPDCQRKYPCLELKVAFQAGSTQISETFLFEKWQTLFEETKCMVFEKTCGSNDPDFPTDVVTSLKKKYGAPGSPSDCYYNPDDPSQVVLILHSISTGIYVVLGLGVFFLLLGLILPVVLYLSCGCDYLWGCSPPQDIQDELIEKQRQQMAAQPQQQGPGQPNERLTQDYGSGFNNQNYSSP